MGIQIISVSHKTAPLQIRELFAFSKEEQIAMMKAMTAHLEVSECIVLSTCNRTEMYVYAESESESLVYNLMEDVLLGAAHALDEEDIGEYLLMYHDRKAIRHLFQVTAGLDSMVIGEDQILGQVKTAHQQAREAGTTGVYLNTFFRMAVTASKKVKTETELSKTSVSTATLALKVAEDALGSLKNKNVMIIGATGKIGGIVLMNLNSMGGSNIYCTVRNNRQISTKHGPIEHTSVEYEERYGMLDQMDVVISATSSPHYTLSYNKMMKALPTKKPRVFVDLAVPMDIESRIGGVEDTVYYNIDDFHRIAQENNEKKLAEAKSATGILEDYELQFEQWLVFQRSLPLMRKVRDNFMKVTDVKGVEKAFDHLFYWVRENNSPEDLETFFKCLNH